MMSHTPDFEEAHMEDLDKVHDGEKRTSILDERLPHRFGNRKQRRKMQSEIRKLMHNN